MMSTALTLPKAQTPGAMAAYERAGFLETVAPSGCDFNTLMATYIVGSNQLPEACTKASVAKSVYNGVRLGLACGPPLNHAHLVSFKDGKASQKAGREIRNCQLVIGYEGYVELAYASKFITSITCQVQLEDEPFRHFVDIDGERIEHDITDREDLPSRTNIARAYCLWQTVSGGRGLWVVNRKQIAKVDKNKDVWNSDYPAMCLKTAIRRAAKLWKKTPLLAAAIQLDEQAEREAPQDAPGFTESTDAPRFSLDDVPEGEPTDDEKAEIVAAEQNGVEHV